MTTIKHRAMNIFLHSAQTANIFVTGQPVSFSLSHDQESTQGINIVLVNELGSTVHKAGFSVHAGQSAAVSTTLPPGYYEATAQGTGTNAEAATTVILAVITPLPANVPSAQSPFGVMTHFQQNMNTNVLPLLALAGIRHVRDEQLWQVVEANGGGVYNYTDYAPYMAALEAVNIDPLLIADFANPNYDGGNTPYTPAGATGYANYAGNLALTWKSQVNTVEIWNEYNGSFCQGPATTNRPENYTAMLSAAYQAIKAQSPATTVIGGATVLVPTPYFEQLFAAGLYNSVDGYCVHPYYSPAESVTRYFENFRAAEAAYSGAQGPKPIWATECGMDQGDDGTTARRELGIYMVKLLTTLLTAGVERVYWYLARDWGSFTTGLLHDQFFAGGSYAPTVPYVAFAALNNYLSGATYVGRDTTRDRRTYSYHFKLANGTDFRVLYSNRTGPSKLTVHSSGSLQVLNFMGSAANAKAPGSMLEGYSSVVTLTDEPVYLLGPVTSIVEDYNDRLLTDSTLDFSSTTQGTSGWSYGWRTDQNPTFNIGTPTQNGYDYLWTGPYYYLEIAAGFALPSAGTSSSGSHYQVWATRRYLPSETVAVQVTGSASRTTIGHGDGAGLNILLNGQTVFSQTLGTTAETCDTSFDLTFTLQAGEPLDFCITPGPGYDNSYDSCSFDVQIIALN